ncbi:P-loop containing nucleoside triphosphate hydrolase protein [Dendrothele bispora CBS 962.96]|uniref:P-loop containing nucleoside triphosphate hydrolase protein n=1 Tax=Dendrothele bispora (strain CBS 962.96) TaxID=1314807 RepID=A0A4S8KPI3_DENBC|nr:P-loop containing nucleoside triphosphate hydrolase protein [Dendrothele bispora CBS 962.96]
MSTESTAQIPQGTSREQAKPSRPRTLIARYDQYFDLRTFSVTLRKTSKTEQAKKINGKDPVLVIRRIINHKGQYQRTDVDIRSLRLRDVFVEMNKDVLGFRLTGDPATTNPQLFFHCRHGLLERLTAEQAKETPDEALMTDLNAAIDFANEHHHQTLSEVEGLLQHQEITFEHLWTIFPPNIHVYHRLKFTEQDAIMYARSFSYEIRVIDDVDVNFGVVLCDFITHDGNVFGFARRRVDIKEFLGSLAIQDLDIYPLQYHSRKDELRGSAVQRGEKFARINKSLSYNEVAGASVIDVVQEDEAKPAKIYSYGRLVVDPVTFRRFNPDTTYNIDVYKAINPDNMTKDEHMICSPFVLGFCLGTKLWGGFALDRIHDIDWSDEPFSSLVLSSRQKMLIHALVKQHAEGTKLFDDVVRGKGKGLIGLLTGNPGCGKTLTAEAVAEVTRRPLYVVSTGELGTSPEQVDKQLQKILELAQIWNAVVLLDEAEVFLQARSGDDIARNALVSIFLRQLEYYQGILILTTNMAAQFDPAMESRIHFCVHYPDLDHNSRRQIWEMFLKKSAPNATQVIINDEALDRLSHIPLNGRQIKNVVSSAQSIAVQSGESLSPKHIDTVLEVLNDWKKARGDSA